MDESLVKPSGARRFFKWLWKAVTKNFGYKLLALGTAMLIWLSVGYL